jgi:hypothetical protein
MSEHGSSLIFWVSIGDSAVDKGASMVISEIRRDSQHEFRDLGAAMSWEDMLGDGWKVGSSVTQTSVVIVEESSKRHREVGGL